MGILDDAIREHLDLKRQHGAQEDEVQILEDEAFGPPSRPGEPDFPERPPTGEQAIEGAATEVAEEAPSEELPAAPESPPPAPEEPPAVAPAEPAEAPAETAGFFDQAGSSDDPGEPTVEHPAPAPPEDEVEPAAAEHVIPEPAEQAPPPPAPEPEPAPAEPASDSGEFEIGEIELEIDEEFEEFREPEEPAAEAPPAPPAADPVETETETELEEDLGAPVSDESDEHAAVEVDREEEAGEEDVLEETPEFLRDTPEDERLWFEQGSPKDFDFDDDEDGDDK